MDLLLTAKIERDIPESGLRVVTVRHRLVIVLVQAREEFLQKDDIGVHGLLSLLP